MTMKSTTLLDVTPRNLAEVYRCLERKYAFPPPFAVRVEPSSLLLRPLLAYCTSPEWWWMMISVEQSVEWLAGEPEVLWENLFQCRFAHQKSHMIRAETRAAAVGSRRLPAWAGPHSVSEASRRLCGCVASHSLVRIDCTRNETRPNDSLQSWYSNASAPLWFRHDNTDFLTVDNLTRTLRSIQVLLPITARLGDAVKLENIISVSHWIQTATCSKCIEEDIMRRLCVSNA
jgi:hypothetical protein